MADTDLDRLARTIAARLAARGETISADEAQEQLATLQEQLETQRQRGYLHPTEGWVSGGWPD